MKIIDISLPITPETATYPGDPEVEIVEAKPYPSLVSLITLGTHVGTHVDAPKHVFAKGRGIDQIPLSALVGPCRVLDMTRVSTVITVKDFERARIKRGERILVKTKNSARGFKKFRDDFIALDGDAADYLAQKRIALFGIDAWSVKRRGAGDLRAHTSLLGKNIVIVELLDLAKVKPGRYTLVVLPLKLIGLDGAPARAILTP